MTFGLGTAVVITGSMEPAIIPGDIIIIQERKDYETGDIITYKANSYITHRIMEKVPNGYITKGDVNDIADSEIRADQVVGKVISVIPRVGHIVFFLQNPLNLLLSLLLLFVLFELPRLLRRRS